ncbi:MAG: ECF-type sigma factor [Pseudomonadota bacterium]
MTEITQLLAAARDGDGDALKQVFEDIYPELKRLASARLAGARAGHTITPTVLVNETYLKLSGARRLDLVDRRHFFVCASKAMRQILIDHARKANAQRRGGDQAAITLTENLSGELGPTATLLDLNEALADLGELDAQLHDLVELKFFGGLTVDEIADLTERSARSVKRDWSRARAFLHAQLGQSAPPP